MNRILACIIALMIALSAAGALAAPGDAMLGRSTDNNYENYYSGCFAVDDTLYVFNGANIATWRAGDAALVDYTFRFLSKEGEEDVTWSCWPFAANGKVYALAFATRYGENTEFLRAVLCEVSLTGGSDDGNLAKLTEKTPLKWDDMINYYDQDSTATEPQSCVGMGNLCCMLIYADSGMQLRLLNLDTGDITVAEGLPDICAVTPYKDGGLLVEQFSYDDAENVRFSVYDPQAGNSRQIAQVKVDNSSSLPGLAYDAAADRLYCIKGGEIHSIDLEKGELGPAIADAPVEFAGDNGGCILGGGLYCYAAYGAFVRNIDPAQRKETRIRVYDSSYSDPVQKAAFTLPNAHGEISVALDRDYSVGQRLVESMMNQDDSVDVYIMYLSDEKFNAVYNRGYMAQIDGSEKLTALSQRMYPAVQAALSQNGHLVGIPVACSASAFGVNVYADTLFFGNWHNYPSGFNLASSGCDCM